MVDRPAQFKGEKRYADLFGAIRYSKDPPTFIVLFEDSAALIGLMIAFVGIYFSVRLNFPVLDGAASILIGLVLAVTAGLLARETKGLLIGERADQRIHDSILRIAGGIKGVAQANGILTIHPAPQQILVALSLAFECSLTSCCDWSGESPDDRRFRVRLSSLIPNAGRRR